MTNSKDIVRREGAFLLLQTEDGRTGIPCHFEHERSVAHPVRTATEIP